MAHAEVLRHRSQHGRHGPRGRGQRPAPACGSPRQRPPRSCSRPSRAAIRPPDNADKCVRHCQVSGCIEAKQLEVREQPTQIGFAFVSASASDHIHYSWPVTARAPSVAIDSVRRPIDRAGCGLVVPHSGRSVGRGHPGIVGPVSAGRSIVAHAPRMACACSRIIAWSARLRSATLRPRSTFERSDGAVITARRRSRC